MSLQVRIQSKRLDFELDVDFSAEAGVTALFGASGAGKTTIIQAVAGLRQPDRGQISLNDVVFFDSEKNIDVPTHRRQLGYVFQDHRLFPQMSVLKNLTYGRRARGLARDPQQFERIIDLLGLEALLTRFPAGLSGGEKQRVAIGRALLSEPAVLLLDEPLASLDQARRLEIMPYLERLRDQTQIPMLYVSHSVSEVARLANQVVLLEQGQQVKAGSVTDVFSDPEAARYMGRGDLGTVIFAQVHTHHPDGVTELAAAGGQLFLPKTEAAIGETQRVRIKAQDVMLSLTRPVGVSALNILSGRVTSISETNGVLVQIKCGADHLLAQITKRSANALDLHVGQPIHAVLKTVSVARGDVGLG